MSTKILSMLKPRTVGIWIRVSTEFQAKGDSPQHHEVRAREYATAKNWTVEEAYRLEAVSGKSIMEHPETQRMLQDIRSGRISCLIVSKFARLVRNTRELLEISDVFQEYNADLVSLDEPINIATSSGRLFLSVMGALAEWEREEIGARVAASIPVRCKLGKSVGGAAPFGYKWINGKLVVDLKEAPIRKLIYELFIEHKRKKHVARLLNEARHRTRNGSKFTDTTVDRLIRDPSAKGMRRANYTKSTGDKKHWIMKPESEWVMVSIEPIISEDLWEEANRIIDLQRDKLRRPGRKTVHLLTGVLYCGCGQRMYKPSNTGKYVCCKCRNKVALEIAEQHFLDSMRSMFTLERMEMLSVRVHSELSAKRVREKELAEQRSTTQGEMDQCYRAYITKSFDTNDFGRYYKPLKDRLRLVEAELAELRGEIEAYSVLATPKQLRSGLSKITDQWWLKASFEKRRQLIENIVRKVTVTKNTCIVTFHHLCSLPQEDDIDFTSLALLCGMQVEISRNGNTSPEIPQLANIVLTRVKSA